MQVAVTTQSGAKAEESVEISDVAFGEAFNESLVHQVVTAYFAGMRSGTKAQKNRAQVRGGGAKPWRQKGMGRARAGSSRNPLWRSGGVTFAAKPRDYSQKINRKMYRKALRSVVSELLRQDRLVVVESIDFDKPRTKALVSKLHSLNLYNVLIVTEKPDTNLELSARNLHNVAVLRSTEVNPANLIAFDKVLMTVSALKQLEQRLL